jgi:hypothetical protein
MPNSATLDRQARELYDLCAPHWPGCKGLLSHADQLQGRCPHCDVPITQSLAPDVCGREPRTLLIQLRWRRSQLGLKP